MGTGAPMNFPHVGCGDGVRYAWSVATGETCSTKLPASGPTETLRSPAQMTQQAHDHACSREVHHIVPAGQCVSACPGQGEHIPTGGGQWNDPELSSQDQLRDCFLCVVLKKADFQGGKNDFYWKGGGGRWPHNGIFCVHIRE